MHKERWWWPFPLASMLGSSSAIVLGRDVYGAGERPIIRRIHRVFSRLQDMRYWVRYRTERKHMYHLIDTKLPPGYYDYDQRMLHGCMSLLCDYVENRFGDHKKLEEFIKLLRADPDAWGAESLELQAAKEDEALSIYCWWKFEREPAHEREAQMLHELYKDTRLKFNKVPETLGSEALYEMELEDNKKTPPPFTNEDLWKYQQELRDKDQEMLQRLVSIREGLWD